MISTKTVKEFSFKPHFLIRNKHVQTVVSSLIKPSVPLLQQYSQTMVIETAEGVQLQGEYTPQQHQPMKGTVFLLHGWLGSINSTYNVVLGEHFYQHGYAVFRLNFRDHGQTHHLNKGTFRSDLLEEVFDAAHQVARFEPEHPFYIAGSSLGGNFALRLAWRHIESPIPNLRHTAAVCPVIDPYKTALVLDKSLYLPYFRRRWRESMRQKQVLFPDYDFAAAIAASTSYRMTELFMQKYSPYPDVYAYFDSYKVTTAMMRDLTASTTILAAADDPIIPIAEFEPFFELTPHLDIRLERYGGHVGFIDIFPTQFWTCEAIRLLFESA